MLHLFHPAIVHFPIALLVFGGGWEACGLLFGRAAAVRGGGILTLAGTLALLPTVVSGYVASYSVAVPTGVGRRLGLHELGAWLVVAVFVALLFWKGWNRGRIPESQRVAYAILLSVGVLLVAFTALFGGELVFIHGVGVK